MNTCYIFGAADGFPKKFKKKDGDIVIAADAGFTVLKKMNIIPDIVLGDFDSLGGVPDFDGKIIKHPIKKDDTDTLLAVKTGFEQGFKRFVIYGGTGKRLDHTLANIQTLSYISNRKGRAFLCGDDFTVTTVTDGLLRFKDTASGTISAFSCVTKAENVCIKGLLYEIENAEIGFDFPIGVSNEFVNKSAEISVGKGTVAVIWSGDLEDLEELF